MYEDRLRARLKAGQIASGLVVAHSRSAQIARIAASCGFDWLFVDLEHGPTGLDAAAQICVAALDAGITPIVRVPANEPAWIGRALDGGAVGVVVPHVDSPQDAARAAAAARFPPAGARSLSGLLPQFGYRQMPAPETMKAADALTFLVGIIETADAIDRIDEIAAVPGIDALQVGATDLSVSLGVPGEVEHPRVQDAVRRTIEACWRHGKVPGLGGAYREDAMRRYAAMGIRLMLVGNDLALLVEALRGRAAFAAKLLDAEAES
ncbi:MAG TPA: aldolase/citrate lyase family protein [Xanthobacteraceae bacterium]|nr:aldolase/citrate lyase family protein [Xanthobacteraceae bacterium]